MNATTVARPTFREGAILPAADLMATVNYPRDQMARHDRYLHSWGIATGLELSGKPADDGKGHNYKDVTLAPGIAIDGTGREIVVTEQQQLSPEDFQNDVVPLVPKAGTKPKDDPWYPVFLTGVDQAGQAPSTLTGACGGSQPTRTQESFTIRFGAPGSELNLEQQQTVGVSDPPGDGSINPWRVLLGFVQWSRDLPKFSDVKDTNPDGVGRRYVGVNAERVISGSGHLLLATHPDLTGPNPVMAVEIQEADKDGKLVFGKLNANGTVTPALTVTVNGDLTASGQVSGVIPGIVRVQSGMAFDGMLLPLPIGIDPADVDAGKVTLHIHVSPNMDRLQTPPVVAPWTGPWAPFPYECKVDTGTRQVRCRIQWWDMGHPPPPLGPPAGPGPILPALCDYTVIAAATA